MMCAKFNLSIFVVIVAVVGGVFAPASHAELIHVSARQEVFRSLKDPVLASLAGQPTKPRSCVDPKEISALSQQINVPPYYRLGRVNPQWRSAVEPLISLRNKLANLAAAHIVQSDPQAARCIGELLHALAKSGALESYSYKAQGNRQAWFEVGWSLFDVSFAYLIAEQEIRSHLPDDALDRIDAWLARASHAHLSKPGGNQPYGDCCNNLLYWRAAHAAAIGVATGDEALAGWAAGVFRDAINQMHEDGAFVAEMQRGKQAVHYQSFAIWPLVLTARILEDAGWALFDYEHEGRSLRTAIQFLLRVQSSPEKLHSHSTKKQTRTKADAILWADIAYSAYEMPALKPYLGARASPSNLFGGGYLAVYFYTPQETLP